MARSFNPNSHLGVILFGTILIALVALSATSQAATVRFAKAVTYPEGGSYLQSVAVGDLNGDGHPDVVVANLSDTYNCDGWQNPCIGRVSVLLGNGNGTFQPAVFYPSGGYDSDSIAVADLNGDGKPDLVVASGCQNSDCNNGSVSVLLGNGDGTFQSPVSYSSGEGALSVAIADVNGDGKPDIVAGTCLYASGSGCSGQGEVAVLLGNGDGSFQPAVTYSSGGFYSESVAIGDVNGDGRPDIAVANGAWSRAGSVSVLLGNGDGTFQPAVLYPSGGHNPCSIVIADVNGDGKPDLLVANAQSNSVGVLMGNGDGTFQAPIGYPTGAFPAHLAIGDVNGDSHLDLVVACIDSGAAAVLAGNGDGTFEAAVSYGAGGAADSLALADLNGDGRLDVVVGNWGSDLVGVLLNTFTAKTTTALTSSLNPSYFGQLVTFSATVTSTPPVPDGQLVTFYNGTTAMASVALVGGTAAYSTSSLSGKTHYIHAKYSGNAFFKPSTGSITQVVLKYPTTTALTSSPNPSAYKQTVTFTATVTPTGPYPPTGKVRFLDGTTAIGSATLSGGVAILTWRWLSVGTHAITAQYLGDAGNAASTSPVLNQVVQ